jgi:urocanate hydratase
MLSPTDLQRQTLRLYGELISRREHWGGQLVFAAGEGCSASGLPAAVSIAGGTTLAVDPDAAAVKSVFRQGGVDFVVNTLDEALRVLKNEVRQHRPLGVALIAEVEPVLAEMAERGVLPDLHVSLEAPSELLFQETAVREGPGKEHLHLATSEGIVAVTPHLAAWLAERHWLEHMEPSTPESPLRALDAQLLAALSADDIVRRTWLQRISHYQRPGAGGVRVLWQASGSTEGKG